MARRLRVSEAQLAAVAADELAIFEPAWRAALSFANDLSRDRGVVGDEGFAAVSSHFSTEQIVEVTAVVSLFNYFNRFANGLKIPVTR